MILNGIFNIITQPTSEQAALQKPKLNRIINKTQLKPRNIHLVTPTAEPEENKYEVRRWSAASGCC